MKHKTRTDILVIWAGRHRRDGWSELCERYARRIRPMAGLEELVVRVPGGGDGKPRLEAEGRAILAALPDRGYVATLDSQGEQRTSKQLAAWLGRRLEGARRPLVFVVGSDLGLARKITEMAHERVSFGLGTLPHELARVVLHEQIYRSLSILGGMKYHREPL